MFKNEASVIERMLESCYKYIDYYVLQDNGSTDGTVDIVENFFKGKGIPGIIYEVKEGWVSFGWNRDHLLQTCLKTDHGCDWILKMDCDEYLEVDDDFDWSPINDTTHQSFHVSAENPGCLYYRAWMWNAKLPWHFKHDLAHECIVCDLPGVGEDFERFNLPYGFRQIGTFDGESYSVPTKYLSDALKLEEKHIKDGDLLEDTYHFWYIGKSYHDCCSAEFYPLGHNHSREYARRAIFYYDEWLNHTQNYRELGHAQGICEMAYFTLYAMGDLYRYLKEYERSLDCCSRAEEFCPVRNEHIVGMAECFREMGDFVSMKEQTERLVDPERKLPYPKYYFLVNNNFYIDSGDYGKSLHKIACDNTIMEEEEEVTMNVDDKEIKGDKLDAVFKALGISGNEVKQIKSTKGKTSGFQIITSNRSEK